jgi:hypothetical protein
MNSKRYSAKWCSVLIHRTGGTNFQADKNSKLKKFVQWGDWAIRVEHSREIAYGKLGFRQMAKNGIFYRVDVLFLHADI